ncbi:MAG: amino acid permease [Legionellales bacterium]|nr:amino acid permease [Legionellales bacterium]
MNHQKIKFWSVVMLTVVSVASLRNLPSAALFGEVLVGYYILAGATFLLPVALVSAELSSHFEGEGGVFAWVSRALGPHWGLYAIWLQWIENVIWYPTILSFIVGTLFYVVAPQWIHHKTVLASTIIAIFGLMTGLNLKGMFASARFSVICTWLGLIIPMGLVIFLGGLSLIQGQPLYLHVTWSSWMPDISNTAYLMSLSGIALSLCGVEVVTVHAQDVHRPAQTYPKALLLSAFSIVFILILGSLSVAAVLPKHSINLVSGVIEAFKIFLDQYHMASYLPLMALMLVVGGLGAVNNWIIAPARGLLIAAQSGYLPQCFAAQNQQGAPVMILYLQALVVGVLCLIFLYFPTLNQAYWFLTVLASQFYMVMYLLLFVSCWILKRKSVSSKKFSIPGGIWGTRWVCVIGGSAVVGIFLVGFLPPEDMQFGGHLKYHLSLILSLILLSVPPFLLKRFGSDSP